MPMILTLTGPRGSGDHDTRTLRNGTLSIGRAPGNDWVLPDPDRHLSKTHCMVVAAGGRYMLTDISTNGVFINGSSQRVPRNGQIELTDGDEICLGDYTITLREGAGTLEAGHAPQPLGAMPAGDRLADPDELTPAPLSDDPFDSPPPAGFVHPVAAPPPGAFRGGDPFDLADEAHRSPLHDPDADFFRGVTPSEHWQGPSQADNADAPVHAFAAPKPMPVTNFDDLDIDALLGDTPPGEAPPPPVPHPVEAGYPRPPTAPAMQRTEPTSLSDIDALLGDTPPGQAQAQPLPRPRPPAAPARPTQAPTPQPDIDGLLGDIPPEGPTAPEALRPPATPRPVVHPQSVPAALPSVAVPSPSDIDGPSSDPFGASAPPSAARTPRPSAPGPAAAHIPAAKPADAAALIAGFLEGAGVADLNLGADPEAAMRAAGAVFRALVEGLRQVLISRAAIKNEFRVEQTMLRARDNNALKFSVTTEDALAALLQPDRPGYQPPLTAAQEAFDDVRGHELAVMAGVQTALMALLRRFEPGALEKRLMPGMLGSLLPAARKARTWELFCATYKDIAHDAEGDFQSVFGREFARAYDEQARKL